MFISEVGRSISRDCIKGQRNHLTSALCSDIPLFHNKRTKSKQKTCSKYLSVIILSNGHNKITSYSGHLMLRCCLCADLPKYFLLSQIFFTNTSIRPTYCDALLPAHKIPSLLSHRFIEIVFY